MSYYNKSLNHKYYPNDTFYTTYQNYQPGYDMNQYQPGCGIRRRRNPSAQHYNSNPNRRGEDMPSCQYMKDRDRVNMYRKCCCALRYQPLCDCDCYKMPSLLHKLYSAPYTKYTKKQSKPLKLKNKQTQTQPEKQNKPVQSPHVITQPHITYIQRPHPIQQRIIQPIINQIPQQQVTFIPNHNPIVLRGPVPNQNSAISFKTIPVQNTQHSIKIIPNQVHQSPYSTVYLNQPPQVNALNKSNIVKRSSIFRPSLVLSQMPLELQKHQLTARQTQNNQPKENIQIATPIQPIQTISNNNPQFNPFFFRNGQNFSQISNLQSSQGRSSLSISKQQQNQQMVSFSSKTQQISSKQQSFMKKQQINQSQAAKYQIKDTNSQEKISATSSEQN